MRFGQVVKLNPISATVIVCSLRWRVSYGLLMPLIDDDLRNGDLLMTGKFIRLAEEDSALLPTTGQ